MRDELTSRRDAITAARAFEDAHSAIDAAIGSNATLITRLMEVRSRHMSGVSGQAALEGTISGLTTLTVARKHVICAHGEATQLGEQFGLLVRGEGGGYPKPAVSPQLPEEAGEPDRRAA